MDAQKLLPGALVYTIVVEAAKLLYLPLLPLLPPPLHLTQLGSLLKNTGKLARPFLLNELLTTI